MPDANRTRAWIAGAVAVAVVAVGALVFLLTRPPGTLRVTPAPAPITSGPTASASVSPSASATGSRTPSASASVKPIGPSNTAPATLGQLPATVKLLHEGAPADGDTSAWELAPWGYGCPGRIPTFQSFGSLVASRNVEATGIEWAGNETILVFATDAAATKFLDELAAANAACAMPGDEPDTRIRTAASAFDGPWDAGLALRSWDEQTPDGGSTWNARPGASLDLVVRRGRAVTLSSQGGEFVGDPWAVPTVVAEGRKAIDHITPSLCAFTAAGC